MLWFLPFASKKYQSVLGFNNKKGCCLMNNKKRRYICVSLLLTGALCISNGAAVWANSESVVTEQEDVNETISDIADKVEESEFYQEETQNWENKDIGEESPVNEESFENTVSVEDSGSSEINGAFENSNVSQNSSDSVSDSEVQTDNSSPVSENSSPSENANQQSRPIASDNRTLEKGKQKDVLQVIFPTDISFGIVLSNEKGLKGIASSNQYCIENNSDADISISLNGICKGEDDRDCYVIGDDFAENKVAQGKKNVWMHLRWEKKDRSLLDKPGMVMGDASAPGKGKIIMQAHSKAYFSFNGALWSDMDEPWRDNELTLELTYSVETAESTQSESENLAKGLAEDTESLDSISDNGVSENGVSDNSISKNSVSENGVSDNSVSKNSVSENSVSDNGVSENSTSENSVSDNSISKNSVSENSVSDNSVSENASEDNTSHNSTLEDVISDTTSVSNLYEKSDISDKEDTHSFQVSGNNEQISHEDHIP